MRRRRKPRAGAGVRSAPTSAWSVPRSGLNRVMPSSAGLARLLGDGQVGVPGALGHPVTAHRPGAQSGGDSISWYPGRLAGAGAEAPGTRPVW